MVLLCYCKSHSATRDRKKKFHKKMISLDVLMELSEPLVFYLYHDGAGGGGGAKANACLL